MSGYVFRANNPAIVGCDIFGYVKPGYTLFKSDKQLGAREVGEIKQLQKEGSTVESAKTGDKLAVSISGPTVGRQIIEGDVLYTSITSEEFKRLKQFEKFLSQTEKEVLKEIYDLKRKSDPRYGI
jgi:translation initiation factor 5B